MPNNTYALVGIAQQTSTVANTTNQWLGQDGHSIAFWSNGSFYHSNVEVTVVREERVALQQGQRVGLVLDLDEGWLELHVNGAPRTRATVPRTSYAPAFQLYYHSSYGSSGEMEIEMNAVLQ